jgi:hypothetical protein
MTMWLIVEKSTNRLMMPAAFASEEAASIYLQGTCSWNQPGEAAGLYIAMPVEARWNLDNLIDPSGTRARLRCGERSWWEVLIGRGDSYRYIGGWLIMLIKWWFILLAVMALGEWMFGARFAAWIPRICE